jgi:hypothetical protein
VRIVSSLLTIYKRGRPIYILRQREELSENHDIMLVVDMVVYSNKINMVGYSATKLMTENQ